MRLSRLILNLLLVLLIPVTVVAQDVIVTVTPVQEILPPQALLYVSNPGQFFNVSLTNTSSQPQDVYLAMQVQQVNPSTGLSIITPSGRQPDKPITIPANGVRQLDMIELKTLFNHVPASEISATPGLFDDYNNGSFALLPEGQYQVRLTAYRWANPKLSNPVAVSNPVTGTAHFTVCYKAQAPEFLLPSNTGFGDSEIAKLDVLNPLFVWTTPVVACNSQAVSYKYSFKIVEVLPGQNPDDAMDRNPAVYSVDNLMVAQCMLPVMAIQTRMYVDRTYAAQVTATGTSARAVDYVSVENEGKSSYRLFRLKVSDVADDEKPEIIDDGAAEPDSTDDGDDDDALESDSTDVDDISFMWLDSDMEGELSTDSLYTFSNPIIEKPQFSDDNGARKMFVGQDLKVEWIPVYHQGGEGARADTLEFAYDVEIFRGGNAADKDSTLATKPIYSKRTTEHSDSIPWTEISELVEKGCYMVLRVKPVLVRGSSVAFTGDRNVRDFALTELLSKKYFQCYNSVEITNFEPTGKTASELKGSYVTIGEYQLLIDEIVKGNTAGTWKGSGRVVWKPAGMKVNVCVKFDTLRINTEDVVYGGLAYTYSQNASTSGIATVDKLFSDWGLDNLIVDTGISFADELQDASKNKVKDIAKKLDLSTYYKYVKNGSANVRNLGKGNIERLYMPVALPKEINKSPVDIQIASMKFAPTYATMDVIGEFALPNSNITKNDILIFGAPRLCISPERILPESGTVALLSDITVSDKSSGYSMTFKAPNDVMEPLDGCFISWHGDALELLGIDMDMVIPKLVKDNNGSPTKEKPVMNVRTTIGNWDDWMVDNVTIDPFQVEDLPGWTFTASDIVYDHSFSRNSSKMTGLPSGYDYDKAGMQYKKTRVLLSYVTQAQDINNWEGLFIKKVGILFPKTLEFGDNADKRLEVSAENMYFDKSGASLNAKAANILSAKTGKAGGWEFSFDKVYLSFLQNNFNDCGFSGKFAVPLLSGQIAYDCKIKKLTSNTNAGKQYAYIFKTQQVEGLSLDFILANATFNKDQTYFLLESVPDANGNQNTNCELVMGGDVTIGGADYLNKKLSNKLDMNFEIPGVHFCGMRISNTKSWTSKYESTMQSTAKNATLSGTKFLDAKDLAIGNCYINFGKWSLASPQKSLGGFSLSLSEYKFKLNGSTIDLYMQGKISLVSGIDISAKAGIDIFATTTLPKSLTDLKDIKLKYSETKFSDLSLDLSFAGMEIAGTLNVSNDPNKEGYEGSLLFSMPGDLFTVEANGGYYKYGTGSSAYTYGWFYVKAGGNVGIDIPPVKISSITAGFYYNCSRNGESANPKKGVIGVVAGLRLATTAGDDALNADMEMTVCYDSKNDRLSTFIFTGKVSALSDLVKADCNLVYENDIYTKYLQLDITIDAKADTETIVNQMTGANTKLSDMKKALNPSFKSPVTKVPEGSLSEMSDVQSKPDPAKDKKVSGKAENLSVSAGSTIALQIKVTWKQNRTTYQKPHWHLYLGEPEISKRCTYTYLQFKSSIVNVNIGANGYLCIGNELPDNGSLPDIPSEVSKFLNGSGNGKGLESASLQQAKSARQSSVQEFEDQINQIGGGVMFGGQVYGYFDVDLGIFYLNAGATAGFDISLVKSPNDVICTNLNGKRGYKGWYGYGQLYAYLYAKFGIKIDLGFWKTNFDVADAGVGGLFRMQGPKPTHFEGKARVKLKLLGGLVNVDRKFEFECGQGCDLFYGNALDDFKLFGDLSIGYDNKDQGWSDNNKIDPVLLQKPYFTTEAPLDQPFRVLDETMKEKLAKNFDKDKSVLDMEASRTFIFRSNVGAYVTIKEYKSKNDRYPQSSISYNIKGNSRYINYIDVTRLNPNRYYTLTVSGYAKEIQKGVEVNPMTFNVSKNKYESKAWSQSKTYYFCTGPSKTIPDCPEDLSEYIAIAYPSYYNQIKDYGGSTIHAYESDVKYPTIAFYSDVSKSMFQKGKLKWRLYDEKGKNLICERNAKWFVSTKSHTCNLGTSSAISGFSLNTSYRLMLEYEVSTKDRNNKVTVQTTTIALMMVRPFSGSWQTGRNGASLVYEKPFVGSRIDNVVLKNTQRSMTRSDDYDFATNASIRADDRHYSVYDPYYYIGYLSNYALVGGWEFDANCIDADITTCQSLIYTDKGGVYEGKLNASKDSYNIWNDHDKIMALSVFDKSQWSKFAEYPLPAIDDSKYGYTLPGLDRVPVYEPSDKNYRRVQGYIADMRAPMIISQSISDGIYLELLELDRIDSKGKDVGTEYAEYEKYYKKHRGQYLTESASNGATVQIPYYQFPLVIGSCLNNSGDNKKLNLWTTLKGYKSASDKDHNSDARGHENNAEKVYTGLIGYENITTPKNSVSKSKYERKKFNNDNATAKFIQKVDFSIYRVNGYDYENSTYTIADGLTTDMSSKVSFSIYDPLTYYNMK